MLKIIYISIGLLLAFGLTVSIIWWLVRKHCNFERMVNMSFLYVAMPKKDSKEDKEKDKEALSSTGDFKETIGIMEHLFNALYGMYSSNFSTLFTGQNFFSFEYALIDGQIRFYCVVPSDLTGQFEKQITSFYPDAYVEEVGDYNIFKPGSKVSATYIFPEKEYKFPIKTYQQQKTDPLDNVANALSKLSEEDGAAIQFVFRPVKGGWQEACSEEAANIYNKKKKKMVWWNPLSVLGTILSFFFRGVQDSDLQEKPDSDTGRTTPVEEEQVKAIDSKSNSVGFEVVIRALASSPKPGKSQDILSNMLASFAQFSDIKNNGFDTSKYAFTRNIIKGFVYRDVWIGLFRKFFAQKRAIFSSEEAATVFHFPSARYNRATNIEWQLTKIAAPPKNVPDEGLLLGYSLFRASKVPIYIKPNDRFRHLYVIGQTGMGKSQMLEFLAKQDIQSGKGMCVVDPHGDLAEDILGWLPRERADDVIVFDPADTERPMGLNMLEADTPEEADFVALEAMNMMIKLFGNEIFGPRIQDYFRNGCLTLMADKDEGGAITDMVRLFTDDDWQKYKVSKVENPIVRSFWEKQMANTGQREKQEMIPYFSAKFGQFTTNTMVRNILGQTKSSFDVSKVMNEGKVLLAKLSKGLVGDINANLIGMILVNKIQVAAMRRQNIPKEDRHDFYLYVDEFQNFITDAFESILSEARKYRLGLVIAHQYINQLIDAKSKDEKIKNAVFGNVGTMMNFKIGAQDAEYMSKEMAPTFSDQDLINLRGFQTCIKLNIDNVITQPFSMNTYKTWLLPEKKDLEAAEAYKQLSRLKYGRDKEFVSREILQRLAG